MPVLEIRYLTGEIDRRTLSKRQTFSIGKHRSNDICIDEDGVAPLHGRISWSGATFEVAAAGLDGVDLNGTLIRCAPFREGDVLRVGSVDFVITADENHAADEEERNPKPAPRRAATGNGEDEDEASRRRMHDLLDEDDLLGEAEASDDFDAEDVADARKLAPLARNIGKEKATATPRPARLPSSLRPRPVRPGEKDMLRSPLILVLGSGALVLMLAGAVIWFMIGRDVAQRQYDAAVAEMGQGTYTQAIELFDDFLERYPRHKYADSARVAVGKCRILREIAGATPAWNRGLAALDDFIQEHRDRRQFAELHGDIRGFAERIALGAAQTAEAAHQRDLLAVSSAATRILNRYSPPEGPPAALRKRIETTYRQAEAAILKQETFDAAVAEIEAALENKSPMAALDARRRLLDRYAAFRQDGKLAGLLEQALEIEAALVVREDVDREALVEERDSPLPGPLSLTPHTRSRTGEVSENRTVFAVAKDCCYGLDTVTGEPLWRRTIGLDPPFFPMVVSTSGAGLLLFDTRYEELLLVDRRTGRVTWRQPLGDRPAGPPLIHEGQIYLPTQGGHLDRIDLETGRISTRLTFSQKVSAPPAVVSDGHRLVVAGDESLVYTLSVRPLECETVSFLGHPAGSIEAPLMRMGRLLLVPENDRAESCRLRVLDTRDEKPWLEEVAGARVEGQVRDVPVLRGRELFVPSSDERITAFTVSEDEGQPPLRQVARFQVSGARNTAMHLSVGPDGQLWMASSALRKFQLKTDTIVPEQRRIAEGLSTQPLQEIGEKLFVGRRPFHSAAVLFIQADREQMTSHWRTVLGSGVSAIVGAGDDSAVCVNEQGDIFRVSEGELEAGGFKRTAAAQLRLPDSLVDPLQAVSLGAERLAVFCGMPQPRLWIVDRAGRIERQLDLEQPLEANPVVLEGGLVLPLPGRLKLVASDSEGSPAEDYLAPVGRKDAPRWSCLAALNGEELVALDSRGRLARIQFRPSPVPHLAEVAGLDLDQPVDVEFGVHEGKLFLADAGGRLQMLDASTLSTIAELQLDLPASKAPWIIDNRLYVETGGERLTAVALDAELEPLWTVPLDGDALAGSPWLVDDLLIAAKQNGDIWALDAQSGEIKRRIGLKQPLTLGPRQIGRFLVVPSIDGSLHRIDSVLQMAE